MGRDRLGELDIDGGILIKVSQTKYRVFHNECPNFKTLYFCNHEPQMNETCTT